MKPVFYMCLSALLLISCSSPAQKPQNWTSEQLMQPSVLAEKIKSGKDIPKIYSVGPGALIPGSVDIGSVSTAENLQKLKKELDSLPRNTDLVIYCGCCPFEHCPNVRPAIDALNSMKFTRFKLLNLEHNLKADWIDKGYPVNSN